METANPLNTGSVPDTQNPQEVTPSQGASDASDFQQTAPSDSLTQDAQNLTVESTGEPNNAATQTASNNGNWSWGIGIALIVAVVVAVIYRIFREEMAAERAGSTPVSAAPKKSASVKKAASKKPTKKKSARRKSARRR